MKKYKGGCVMDANIQKVYDMMYSPIITPYNLIQNAKLDNYSYVKYYKSGNGLIAEMECKIPTEGTCVFYYYFDKKDYLKKILMKQGEAIETVFDRTHEIEKAKEEYYESQQDLCKVV